MSKRAKKQYKQKVTEKYKTTKICNPKKIPDDIFMHMFSMVASCKCNGMSVVVNRDEYDNYHYGEHFARLFFKGIGDWMTIRVNHHVEDCDIAKLRLVCKRFRNLVDSLNTSTCKFENKIKKIKSVDMQIVIKTRQISYDTFLLNLII